jgi:high-affinity iron transporter
VWLGVVAAVLLSLGFAALLNFVAEDLLGFEQRELFEAITSILAVAFRHLDDLLDAPVCPGDRG